MLRLAIGNERTTEDDVRRAWDVLLVTVGKSTIPEEVTTERLLLRQWREDDLDPLYEIYVQPEYLATMPAHDRDWTAEQIGRFGGGWRQDGYSQWAACERRSGR